MIVELLMTLIFKVFSSLISVLNIPNFPPEVHTYLDMAFDYLQAGVGILANYAHVGYLLTLFGIIILIDVAIKMYHLIMWVLRKIPMLGIE